jgi:hypothetical protein
MCRWLQRDASGAGEASLASPMPHRKAEDVGLMR